MLAVAVLVAIARVAIRAKLNRRIYVDDGLFFFAVVTLVAGTIMTYIDIPYIYLQQNVQSGAREPPAHFVQQLIHSVKIQDAAVVLLSSTIFAVKLSFMAFFRSLIRRLRKLEIWWWCVLFIVVPSSVMLVISNFITCGYFDERILGKPNSAASPRGPSSNRDTGCSEMCERRCLETPEQHTESGDHPGHLQRRFQ